MLKNIQKVNKINWKFSPIDQILYSCIIMNLVIRKAIFKDKGE